VPGTTGNCPVCGEHDTRDSDFICQFCFGRLPYSYKRKLGRAKGREEEPKKRQEALEWLKGERRRRGGSRA
jgi:hypothetical protein